MLSQSTRQRVLAEKDRYPLRRSAFLPALQIAQQEHGWLSPDVMTELASLLETDPNALYDLATFYSLLHTRPVGRYVVRVCNGLSCYLRGADQLLDHISTRLGIEPGATGADGCYTLEPFECLAACDSAPVLMVNEELYRNLSVHDADLLLDTLATAGGRSELR